MSSTPEMRPSDIADRLLRLEDQMRRMQDDVDRRLETVAASMEGRLADEEVEALATERIRSGAADRAEDGTRALTELGIDVP
jgi:hypothetical protein